MVELVQRERHLPRCRHEQRREADRVRVLGHGAVHDHVQRHLPAQVDHPVAVVGEDRAHQVLADVVDVAEHGREHDGRLGLALEPIQVALEVGHRPLHHLGGLEHERQDQLARAEAVADVLHRRQEDAVQDVDGAVVVAPAALVERQVDVVLDPLAGAVQDLRVQALGRCRGPRTGPPAAPSPPRSARSGRCSARARPDGGRRSGRRPARAPARRSRTPGARGSGSRSQRRGRRRSRGAGTRSSAPRVPAATARTRRSRRRAPSTPRAAPRLTARMPSMVSIALRRNSSCPVASVNVSVSKIRSPGMHAVLADADVVDRLRDRELARGRLGHALVVDRERHARGAVADGVRDDRLDPLAAALHVDRVDQRPARVGLERASDHRGVGRVDHERHLDAHRQALDERAPSCRPRRRARSAPRTRRARARRPRPGRGRSRPRRRSRRRASPA